MRTEVHIIQPAQWLAYRDIRLAALQEAPDAFGSTYAESILYTDAQWQGRLQDLNPATDLPMTILDEGSFVCLGWARIEQPDLLVANLYSMWVAPSHRGRGLGRDLVNAAIDWAKAKGMERLELDVTLGNNAAESLYLSMGFVPVGDPVPLRAASDLLEQLMRRRL